VAPSISFENVYLDGKGGGRVWERHRRGKGAEGDGKGAEGDGKGIGE